MMTWLAKLLEHHPELAMDSAEDRDRLVALVEDAFPREQLVEILAGSLLAVLTVAQQRGTVTSTSDVRVLAKTCARNAALSAEAVLGLSMRDGEKVIVDALTNPSIRDALIALPSEVK